MIESKNIRLCEMTMELAMKYFRDFCYDPAVFMDNQALTAFVYQDEWVKQYIRKQQEQHRIHLAIMHGEQPIGEIILKKVHKPRGSCTLSIHLQNDSVKNRGFGTQAERLALRYAFDELHLETVYADALKKNIRSQHVLQLAGFEQSDDDGEYVYFRCDASKWRQGSLA